MAIPSKHIFTLLLRRRFSAAKIVSAPTIRFINQIHRDYKPIAIRESQKALTEYLHETQGLPFFFADQIANNSLFSLSKLLPNLSYSVKTFHSTIRTFLRYQSINEFEFLFESIGIDHCEIAQYLPRDRFSMSDGGGAVLGASVALFQFGFPWNTLGKLYTKKVSIFNRPVGDLTERLCLIRDSCGFHNLALVGVFLAFPELLAGEGDLGDDFEAVFEDLKRVLEVFDNGGRVDWNLDGWCEVCCKVRFLYEFGCEKGTVWEYMCSENRGLLKCSKQVLEDKINYFCKFGVGKDRVRSLLLRNQELLGLDLQTPVIVVSKLLQHFGLDDKEIGCVRDKYPHVFGRNKMANLPGIARALDVHEWLFDKIENFGSQTLASYNALDHSNQEIDEKFQDVLKKIKPTRLRNYTTTKLNFLTKLGFGENASTLNVLRGLNGTNSALSERFDHFLSLGIKYSELCCIVKWAPGITCVTSELIAKKVNYLCKEMGYSSKDLCSYPRILLFDLENRIKPRHRFCVWLRQTGLLCSNNLSVRSIIHPSEQKFIARILKIHRAAPKMYLECYMILTLGSGGSRKGLSQSLIKCPRP